MSLNQLKIALQDYQRSYRTCVGISAIDLKPKKQENASVSSEFNFVLDIPGPSDHLPIPEPAPTETPDENETQPPKRNPFPYENGTYQDHQPTLQPDIRKPPKPRSVNKKHGLNIMPILLGFLMIMLGGIGYGLYDFYSSKKIVIKSPLDEANLNLQKSE